MIEPIHDVVVVDPLTPDTATKSGILLPPTAQTERRVGRVVSVGEGDWNFGKQEGEKDKYTPTTVRPGDVVLYSEEAIREVDDEGHKYVLMRESNVLGIIEGDPEGVEG